MIRMLPVVVFFLFICWVILQADTGAENIFFVIVRTLPYGDKVGHFILFGMLALLSIVALKGENIQLGRFQAPLGAVIVLGFAVLEELSQLFFINRTFDLIDLSADLLGIVFFSCVAKRFLSQLT